MKPWHTRSRQRTALLLAALALLGALLFAVLTPRQAGSGLPPIPAAAGRPVTGASLPPSEPLSGADEATARREQAVQRPASRALPTSAPAEQVASLNLSVVVAQGPASFARVTLRRAGGYRVSTLCDPGGRCAFEDLAAGVEWSVEVQNPAFLKTQRFDSLVLEPGESRQLFLALDCQGFPFRGRVVDEHGRRVADCQVRLDWCRPQGARHLPGVRAERTSRDEDLVTRTDARGEFEFELLPAGRWWAWPVGIPQPDGSGYLSLGVVCEQDPAAPNEEHVLLLRRGRPLGGRVLKADGAPAARTIVRAAALGSLDFRRMASTDEHGAFTFPALPEGTYSLIAEPAFSMEEVGGVTGSPLAVRERPSRGPLASSAVEAAAGTWGAVLVLREGPVSDEQERWIDLGEGRGWAKLQRDGKGGFRLRPR